MGFIVDNNSHFVVVLGASAGGLETIHDFFDHSNSLIGMSFVVIQHLSSDHKSLLVELVSKHTLMTVVEAGQGMPLKPGYVYIIPNNKLLTVKGNKFNLDEKIEVKKPNTAIDTFLFSLAAERGDKSIAIIMSGTGTDGTKGIDAIKEVGGTVIVQDPNTAKFDGMPNSAIGSGDVDFIVEPKEMATVIEKLVREYSITSQDYKLFSDKKLKKIFSLVHDLSGHDFNYYKTPTIVRRIERRMIDLSIDTLDKYIRFLEKNEPEVKKLGEEFLIGVTCFFRDKQAYEFLEREIITLGLKNKKSKDIFKVWVCACSTGEEAYSIAIAIDRCLKNMVNKPDIKIFATDIDENSLKIAQKGTYPLNISKDVDAATLSEYFVKDENTYTIISRIRKQIVFASHNVIKNPPFIKNDLVSCRNMLIYVNPLLQRKILATFHFALNELGHLFLGSSESASYIKEGMLEINSKHKIYQKIYDTSLISQDISKNLYSSTFDRILPENKLIIKKSVEKERSLDDDFYKVLVEDLNYLGVYIDSDFNIKDTVGDFKKYLSLPDKKLNLNILKMVPLPISGALSTAIRKAKNNAETIILYKEIKNSAAELMYCRLVVKPLKEVDQFLIIFNEVAQKHTDASNNDNVVLLSDTQQSEYIQEIEAELSETKSDLQQVMEDMETANEELQSSNEELLSANEELQSSNEELQSLNEELHTLNVEHQQKIKELTDLNDDLDNYFRSTDFGQIFVDKKMNIRKFNPAVLKIINLIPSDIGRPIEHISTNILYDNFINDLKKVVSEEESIIEKEVTLKNGSKRMLRILPYLKQDKIKDGAVVSFVDISSLLEINNLIKSAFNASRSSIIAFAAVRDTNAKIIDFKILTCNEVASVEYQIKENSYFNTSIRDAFPEFFNSTYLKKYISVVENNDVFQIQLEVGEFAWAEIVAVKMFDGIVLTITDISAEKLASVKLKKNYESLLQVKDTLTEKNTDLVQEIADKVKELNQSEERFSVISKISNDNVWDLNLKTNSVWRSASFVEVFGYNKEELDSSFDFWIKNIHPDDRDVVKESLINAIAGTNMQWTAEYKFKKKNNTYTYVLDRAQILRDENNEAFRLLGFVVDISRTVDLSKIINKQQEEFKKIFFNAPLHIIIKRGSDLKYDFINKEVAEFYNLYDVIGKPTAKVKLGWEGADLSKNEFKVLKSGRAYSEKGHLVTYYNKFAKTEIKCWFDYVIEPVYNHDGNVDGVVTFAYNVTDMLKDQEDTKLLLERKDEFLSIASHELKTPLTSIKGFIQLLDKKTNEDESLKYLNELIVKSNNQINKLSNLVNDLLDVTKINSDKLKLNTSSFNSKTLISDALEGFMESKSNHKITIETNDSVMLHADKNVLEQVINNLISNAIKYSPEESEIIIRSEIKGPLYYFCVKDVGIGIPREKVDLVFQRFFRVNDTSDYYAGLGLGLYICSEIIKKHKGRIGCSSDEGKGSLFWFTIPTIYIN